MKATLVREVLFTAVAASIAVLLLLLMFSKEADAAMCGPHKKIEKLLTDRYQESTHGVGLVSDRGIVQLYISDKGTWSIVMTTAAGSTCIIAAGHAWEQIEAKELGPKA